MLPHDHRSIKNMRAIAAAGGVTPFKVLEVSPDNFTHRAPNVV